MGERFEPRRKAAEYEQFWVQEWKKNKRGAKKSWRVYQRYRTTADSGGTNDMNWWIFYS